MAKVIDMQSIVQEPIVLKFSDEDEFTIPPEPSLDLTYKIADFEDKMKDAETSKQVLDMYVDLVAMILKQDESKEVTKEFVIDNVGFSQMRKIVSIYQQVAAENQDNPN